MTTKLKIHGLNEKSGKYDRCEFKLMAESVRCCRKFRELAKRLKAAGSKVLKPEKSGKYDRCEFKLAESVRCCRKF